MAENKVKLFNDDSWRYFVSVLLGIKSGQDAEISKCIKTYQNGDTYTKDDFVIYLPTGSQYMDFLVCKATHTATTNSPNMAYFDTIDATNFESYDEETLKSYLNLSQEELDTLQNLLQPDVISTTSTWDSSKIYSSIQDAINSSKSYTDTKIASKATNPYKVVSSSTEVVSKEYLYLIDNGTNFDIWAIVEENGVDTAKKIGDTSIDLSQYVQTTTLESDYSTTAECDGKYATISTVDGKADKDSIVTPSSTSTTDQIANAKDTYDMIESSNNVIKKMFTDSTGGDFIDVLNENVSPSDQKIYILGFNNLYTNLPNQTSGWWNVQISGVFSERMCIAKDTWSEAIYTGYIWYDSANTTWKLVRWEKVQTEKDFLKLANLSNDGYARISSWVDSGNGRTQMSFDINTTGGKVERIQFDDVDGQLSVYENDGADNWTWKGNYVRTRVTDIPKSLITWSDETNYKTNATGCYYQVKNGVCYVVFDMICVDPAMTIIKTDMPKPNFDYVHYSTPPFKADSALTVENQLTIAVTNTSFVIYNGVPNLRYLGTFSYPVSEY